MGPGWSQQPARLEGRRLTAPFHELLLSRCDARGGKTALVDAATGRTIPYAAIPDAVERIAAALRSMGAAEGRVVGLLARNSPEYLLLVLGILAAGGAVAPVNPHFLPHEIAAQLEESGATVLVVAAALVEKARELVVLEPVPGLGRIVAVDDALSLTSLSAVRTNEEAMEPGDALLAWSVGPGGLPASARHSHGSLSAALLGLAAVAPWREEDVVFSAISPYDLYGLVSTLALSLHMGMTAVTASRFDPPSFASAVSRFGVTVSNVVPTIVSALVAAPPAGGLAPLRLLISGGAPLAPHVAAACAARHGVAVVQGYGLAEAAGATHVDAPLEGSVAASCGHPIAGTVTRVVDRNGVDVEPGQEGELWLRGAQVFAGYRGRAEKTSSALTSKGWLRTGDLVREDAAKRMTVVGRRKRVVKVKGFQVSPDEIEEALRAHPAVADAVAFPAWDAESGEERARVCVVTRGSVPPAELVEWLASRVARHKRPADVEIVPELPPRDGPWRFPWS